MATVNRPTNNAIKEKDINNKLQLYGIFTAFSNGKVPSNKQIDIAMNSALASTPLASPPSKLSDEGKHLVADLRDVIEKAKMLLLSKNQGDLLQDFLWQTRNLDGGNAKLPGAPTDKDTAKQHGNEALDGLRTLGTLIISNGQFRKLLSDVVVLARDMAGDVAQKAAGKINPDEDRLNQIDEPAEDNTWHDVPSRGDLKSRAKDTYGKNKPFSRQDMKEAGQHGANQADDHPGDEQQSGQEGANAAANNLKERAQQNVPDEHQDRAVEAKRNAQARTKNYMKEKVPKERRDQTIYRLKKMIVEIQSHDDYQQAIETLLNLAETYGGHAKGMSKDSAGTVKGAHADDSLQIAEANLKTLIERFANSTSTDDLFDSINQMYRDADRDPELRDWFKSVDRYVRKCLREQGYVLRDEATEEWNKLNDKGDYLLRDRYKDHTNRILDEFKFLAGQFDQDPQNQEFARSMNKLFQDLGNDENGKPSFKPHLIKDLVNIVIPGIFENTRYVPIPRIEVSDPMIDAVVENLVIESDNLFPNVFEFGNDNYYRLGRKQNSSKNENKVMLAASGIQMDLRDVAYYVKKKHGFPSVTDKGVMDITLAGEGFNFKLAARNALAKDRQHFVVVENVAVKVNNLNIKLKQSNHKLLFAMAKPLLLRVMRPVIQKVIEKQIRDNFEKADAFLWDIYQDVQKGAKAAANDPDNAQNIFQSYINAFQKKIVANKEKAKAKSSNMQVNMAMTQHDSIFKNISLPGGISTKATEFKDLAAKGDKWTSPVFSIGSARESSNIPKLAQIQRKPHQTASGVVRGSNHPNSNQNQNDGGNYSGSTEYSNTGNYGGGADNYSSNTGRDQYSGNTGEYSTGRDQYSGTTGNYSSGRDQYSGTTGTTGNYASDMSGQNTGAYGSNTGTGANAGFGNQVDQAFDMNRDSTPNTGGGYSNPAANAAQTAYHNSVTN